MGLLFDPLKSCQTISKWLHKSSWQYCYCMLVLSGIVVLTCCKWPWEGACAEACGSREGVWWGVLCPQS